MTKLWHELKSCDFIGHNYDIFTKAYIFLVWRKWAFNYPFKHTKNNNINIKYYSNDQQIKINTFTYLDHKFRQHSDETLQKFKEKVLNKETGQNLHIEKPKSFLFLRIYSDETQISRVKYSRVCDRSSWMQLKKSPNQNTNQDC